MFSEDNLLAPPPILLPEDPSAGEDPLHTDTALRHPDSPLVWAVRAEEAIATAQSDEDKLVAYALARTGYHRSLDRLRAHGWKGFGPIPWHHEPNQGVLRAIASLALAAQLIGEVSEFERCQQLLVDADQDAARQLLNR